MFYNRLQTIVGIIYATKILKSHADKKIKFKRFLDYKYDMRT